MTKKRFTLFEATTSMKTKRVVHIILLGLLFAGVFSTQAQNNPYRIKDSLYSIYQRAFQQRHHPNGLLIADTLYTEALKSNDKKAQCLALTVPVQYYYKKRDTKEMEKAVERLRTVSRANNYLQYYYFAYSNEIKYFLVQNNTIQALQKAEEMKTQAFLDKHDYGICNCLRILGDIYVSRNNQKLALHYYKDAADYTEKHLPSQDPSSLYLQIVGCYRTIYPRDYNRAMEYTEKAIKMAKTENVRIQAIIMKCLLLGDMEKYEEFKDSYENVMQQLKHYKYPSDNSYLLIIKIRKCVLDGEYEQAHAYADSFANKILQLDWHSKICIDANDYMGAYTYRTLQYVYRDSVNNLMQIEDIAELNAQIGNERLKVENVKLDLKNADLQMQQLRSQMELERSNAENKQLMLDNRELEVQRLKAETNLQKAETEKQKSEAERQKALLEQQQAASQYRSTIFCIVIFFLIISIVFLILYLYRRRKITKHLREKNEELIIARDQADAANKMKSMFIQNMSHEIRTPLNAIVGFSSVILDPDIELSDEEQKEFSHLIQHNSDLLTTIVNDILRLAELESGHYIMDLMPQRCNEMCQVALSTVAHRKPENVKLYFTSEVDDNYKITTDKQRVEQVLINFLTNAEKHTQEGEIHLHCSLSENPGKITFSVTDTGTGIPADQAETIFERFKKLNSFQQGTGLGLNICRLIAEKLNGSVKLDSSYTKGARFLFILPIDGPLSVNNKNQG